MKWGIRAAGAGLAQGQPVSQCKVGVITHPFRLIRRGGKNALADRIVCSEFLSGRRIKLAFRDELMFGT